MSFNKYQIKQKQYRTMGSHPLHSYLATNRILQLIYDITCIYEREGSVWNDAVNGGSQRGIARPQDVSTFALGQKRA